MADKLMSFNPLRKANPGAQTHFYPSFQRMVAYYVGLEETVFLFFKFYFCIMCAYVLPAYMCAHHMSAWCLRRSEEGIGSPGTGVKDGCESPWGARSKSSSCGRAAGLLTTEPFLPSSSTLNSQLAVSVS